MTNKEVKEMAIRCFNTENSNLNYRLESLESIGDRIKELVSDIRSKMDSMCAIKEFLVYISDKNDDEQFDAKNDPMAALACGCRPSKNSEQE